MKMTDDIIKEMNPNYIILYNDPDCTIIFKPQSFNGHFSGMRNGGYIPFGERFILATLAQLENDDIYHKKNCHLIDPNASVMKFDIYNGRSLILYWKETEDEANDGINPSTIIKTGKVWLHHNFKDLFYIIIHSTRTG